MGLTITVRLTKELARWLQDTSEQTGISQGKLIRDQLEHARAGTPNKRFMRLAGSVAGVRALSTRKGFSRP